MSTCNIGIPVKRQFVPDPETADVSGNSASASQAHGEQPESWELNVYHANVKIKRVNGQV